MFESHAVGIVCGNHGCVSSSAMINKLTKVIFVVLLQVFVYIVIIVVVVIKTLGLVNIFAAVS